MPEASSGIYEVVLEQTYQAQLIFNVFHYINTLGFDDLQQEVGEAFDEDVLPSIATLQIDQLTYDNIRVANLTGLGADVSIVPTATEGDLAGFEAASFISAPFRYNRVTKETRNGAKRFSGLTENIMEDDKFEASYVTAMLAAALILAGDISVPGGVFSPIIIHKPADELGAFTYNQVGSVTALNRQTTQSSRKAF